MKSSVHMRLGRFLYVMKILYDVTPISNVSARPSRMWGSLLRMKWKPKSSTDCWLASSASRFVAIGRVSPSLYSAKAMSVVSPACAAARGPELQSSYTAPRWTWQVDQAGEDVLAGGVDGALGGRQRLVVAQGHDAPAPDRHRRVEHLGGGHHRAAADDGVDGPRGGHHSAFRIGWVMRP
jgi:hypothetical protein